MHDNTASLVDITPVRLGDRWLDDGMDLELWTEDGKAGLRLHATASGDLIVSRLPEADGRSARISIDAASHELSVDEPAGVLDAPADLAWLQVHLDGGLREAIEERVRRARADDTHDWKDGDRPRVSLGERVRFCDVFPRSWDLLVTYGGKRYALVDRYRVAEDADMVPISLEVIDGGTGEPVGTAEVAGLRSSEQRKPPWTASAEIVDQILGELQQDEDEWFHLLSRAQEIARVARRLRTWEADRLDPDAVVLEALAAEEAGDDPDGDADDRVTALGERAIPELQRALEAEEPFARARAASLLAAVGDASGVHVLTAALLHDEVGDDEVGDDDDEVINPFAMVDALERLGAPALEPLLKVLPRVRSELRLLVMTAIVSLGVRDDRIRDLLIDELATDENAAALLADYGDRSPAVADALGQALTDRLDELEADPEAREAYDHALVLADASAALGVLTPPLATRVVDMLGSSPFADDDDDGDGDGDLDFEALDSELPPANVPVRAVVRPGRNEPCWCGSNQKYKRCHLDSDAEADRRGGS
jgi:hypothetical protein